MLTPVVGHALCNAHTHTNKSTHAFILDVADRTLSKAIEISSDQQSLSVLVAPSLLTMRSRLTRLDALRGRHAIPLLELP